MSVEKLKTIYYVKHMLIYDYLKLTKVRKVQTSNRYNQSSLRQIIEIYILLTYTGMKCLDKKQALYQML